MTRRKIALVFLPMFLLVLILTPWASAPSPSIPASSHPVHTEPEPVHPAAAAEQPVRLKVVAALNESEFDSFRQTARLQTLSLPDITVDLFRADPANATAEFARDARLGEPADVVLMDSDWIPSFAVSGYLSPADGVFAGNALSEPFEALSGPLKWNGYLWGVPRDFDPYVLVWNPAALKSLLGEGARTPANLSEWADWAAKAGGAPSPARWIALDKKDPRSLLFWIQSAAGERTDTLWNGESNPWAGTRRGEALGLLDKERGGAAFVSGSAELEELLASGQAAAAVLPYSEAERMAASPSAAGGKTLSVDRSAWKLPYVWFRGTGYAISSRTKEADAAKRWIAAMSEETPQEENWEAFGKLPVSRSLYRSGVLASLFPGSPDSSFPYQAPEGAGPAFPARLDRLKGLWQDFADGNMNASGWADRWQQDSSADAQLHD